MARTGLRRFPCPPAAQPDTCAAVFERRALPLSDEAHIRDASAARQRRKARQSAARETLAQERAPRPAPRVGNLPPPETPQALVNWANRVFGESPKTMVPVEACRAANRLRLERHPRSSLPGFAPDRRSETETESSARLARYAAVMRRTAQALWEAENMPPTYYLRAYRAAMLASAPIRRRVLTIRA